MQQAGHSVQSQLFPDIDSQTVFEQPLNERMRTFLRLEYLFQSIKDGIERESAWDARNAIASMIEVSDQLSRADLKGELIKEIERHAGVLQGLRANPGVNQTALEQTLSRLEPLAGALRTPACQPGAKLRHCELVNQIKQRLAIPGGTCNFDLPAFHYWLSRSAKERTAQLNDWMQDLRLIEDAIATILRLVRESAMPRKINASGGFYQQQIDPALPCQIVRVAVNDADNVFPEISGGKHRFTVRFFRQPDIAERPRLWQETVRFDLQCCGL